MSKSFGYTFCYKVIYVVEFCTDVHRRLVKIGDASLHTKTPIDQLTPNSKELNQAARTRIKQYTNTAGVRFNLLHTELAVRTVANKDGKLELVPFRDKKVHRVLVNSGIPKRKIKGTGANELFEIDLATAQKAIEAVKNGQPNFTNTPYETFDPIILRQEQEDAIAKTHKQFKTGKRMLLNAKMRFGKTLTTLEIVRREGYAKTIIITHRPVVDAGWYEDFLKIFRENDENDKYLYGSKNNGASIDYLLKSGKKFVYFASIQDLRGSATVGGKFDKNDAVFDVNWDLVIVDEAHEGTTTALGDEVIKNLVKEETRFLALSGTPFNILKDYDSNAIYTWDYVMEQRRKKEWDIEHFGDSNPYDELPEMHIYTYNLGKLLNTPHYVELEDKAFNFKEFFRTWTGNWQTDHATIPEGQNVGDFCHEADVESFLNLITKEDAESHYPYANEEYQQLFRHTLWMVPGVREARALSKLLKKHPIFGLFTIVNVAGDGDEEEKYDDALKKVKEAIANAGEDGYTITLSCGKLTTGVTVPEWTAVFMLAGSFSTSASSYLQTIFRVQSPCKKNGMVKENCFVFDFAPDRTLKMIAEAAALSTKAGKATESDRVIMGEFLNYCPIISIDGTEMKQYDVNLLMQQLKRAYAERAVQNGFDDTNLYNDELLKLNDLDLDKFKTLKGIVGSSKAAPKTNEVNLNNQGFTNEEYEEVERISKKPKKNRTEEEEARLQELKEKSKLKRDAISILRSISIRIPLLIYGMNVDITEDITIEQLPSHVDPTSWEEFMPSGVTKAVFRQFIKYYDPDVFIAAGRKIRNEARSADDLPPLERMQKITALLSCFKNPDKETVLTPWRVVNMHMSDCLGGYDFYDETHNELLETPRFVDHGDVTADTVGNSQAQILEINSKTGLYPLYVTYSIFRARLAAQKGELTPEQELALWDATVRENIYVICKTPMAKTITQRTLVGYRNTPINAHYFNDLINMLKNKRQQFVSRVLKPSYWKKQGGENMKFNAVVGNPPYMEMDGGAQASAKPIYNYFITGTNALNPNYFSFIMPARWYTGGKGLDDFRDRMLNDIHIETLYDCLSPDEIFPNTNIRGGICYFLWNSFYDNRIVGVNVYTKDHLRDVIFVKRPLKIDGLDVFIRHGMAITILNKVQNTTSIFMDTYVSPRRPFGIDANIVKTPMFSLSKRRETDLLCLGKGQSIGYISNEIIKQHRNWIGQTKLFTPRANNIGTELNDDNLNTYVGEPDMVCTESYVMIGVDMGLTLDDCVSLSLYLKTKFVRFMHSLAKSSQDATAKTYRFVPVQNFTISSDINWSVAVADIDNQLYAKYALTDEEIAFIESTIKPME
ncbi:MAG: Eco57I restriction-modification methylase domain-containing protein [Planctomycetia bacterium]|nr:Eco57I restriction-modification methylase domain-containing protein [Planctomycetia bacterium]